MVIVYSADEKFVQHLLVSIHSLLDTNSSDDLIIYVLNKDITDNSKVLINENLLDFYKIQVIFVHVSMNKFHGLFVSEHITVDAYFRLAIPALIPQSINRAIYLDCDTIVTEPLEPLWRLSLNGKAFAAVADKDNIRNLEMGLGNTLTFNSGVMVIDVNKWRSNKISEKIFEFISKFPERIKFHDQDVLNEVLFKDILELPVKWNLTTPYIRKIKRDKRLPYNLHLLPAIIHFNGDVKPWHYRLRHPYKKYYYRYLLKTPFKAFIPEDRNIKNIFRKQMALLCIFLRIKLN